MLLEHIMKNILYYFLPLAVSLTIALLTSEKIRHKKRTVFWGNFLLLLFVITFSVLTRPAQIPLQAEWAFYALRNNPLGIYELHSLLGEGVPTFLGLKEQQGEITGFSVVRFGEQSQMRLKLNQKGCIYVFHFDTTSMEVKQLFPSKDVQEWNPVAPDIWVELPSSVNTWKFDEKPGVEVFLVYVSSKAAQGIKEKIVYIVEKSKKGSATAPTMLKNLQKQLKSLAPCSPTKSGEVVHNLTGVLPRKVKTYAYQAQDGKSALFCQFVRHEP